MRASLASSTNDVTGCRRPGLFAQYGVTVGSRCRWSMTSSTALHLL
jgi:hypothetical protein